MRKQPRHKRRASRAYLLGLSALVATGACGLPDDAEFRGAPPQVQHVTIAFPGVSTMSPRLPREDSTPKNTDTAQYYELTQSMAALLNSYALQLLTVARVMVQLPATTRMGESRTWGPYEPGGADPLTYRLVVNRLGEAVFAYTLSARNQSAGSDNEFLVVLDGSVTKGDESSAAKGRMTVHFDNRRKLVPDSCEQGKIDFEYDSLGDPALLDITLQKVGSQNPLGRKCRQDPPRDGRFHVEHGSDDSGNFLFDVRKNIHSDDANRPLLETVLLRSRWNEKGQGRSDGKIADGEVSIDLRNAGLSERYVSFSQCFGQGGKALYQTASPESLRLLTSLGDPSVCTPKTAAFPD